MATNSEKNERILRIIRRLLAKTVDRGCTPGEAANAAAKVQELLQKYQLSMFDVETGEYKEDCISDRWVQDRDRKDAAFGILLNAISMAFDCKTIQMNETPVVYTIIGHASDVATVKEMTARLFDMLVILGNISAAMHGKEKAQKYKYRNGFIIGATETIYNRLKAMRAPAVQTSSSTALVVTKSRAVAKRVARDFPNLRKTRSNAGRDSSAKEAGRKVGERIELSPGVKDQSERKRLA